MKSLFYLLIFCNVTWLAGLCSHSVWAQSDPDQEKAAYDKFLWYVGQVNSPQWEEEYKGMKELLKNHPDFAARNHSECLGAVSWCWRNQEYSIKAYGKEIDDQRYDDLLKYLLENGAKPNEDTLRDAALLSTEKMVDWCLKQGTNVNSRDKYNYTPLHGACQNGETDPKRGFPIVKLLIKAGADVNAVTTDDAKWTPLHQTVNPQIVKALIEAGANVNARDGYGKHPLFRAALGGSLETVKILVENGADVNLVANLTAYSATAPRGTTPLTYSGANPDLEVFKYLLSQGATFDKEHEHPVAYALRRMPSSVLERLRFFFESKEYSPSDERKKNLFFIAANVEREIDVLEYLLEMGCDIKNTHALVELANHYKVNMDSVRFLVENGIDVNHIYFGHTALHKAMSHGKQRNELVKYLVENGADISIRDVTRHLPFEEENESLQYLLDLGIPAGQRDKNGNTLLHHAASGYPAEAVRNLIAHKADVNAKGANGITPLHSVARSDYFTMEKAELLIQAGADPNAKDNNGRTPFWDIIRIRNAVWDNRQKFKQWGVNFRIKDNQDQTLLFSIAQDPMFLYHHPRNGENNFIDFLIEEGVDVNAKDKKGRTALFYAAGQEGTPNLFLVTYLVEHGAEINITDSSGRTPLLAACTSRLGNIRSSSGIAAYLVKKGELSVNVKDKQGLTPLMLAVTGADPKESENMKMTSFPYDMYTEYELINYLIAQGCDINAKDEKGETALDKAVELKNERVALLLLKNGAKSNTDKPK